MECTCVDADWQSSVRDAPGAVVVSAVVLLGWLGLATWFVLNYAEVSITWTIMMKDLKRARNFLVAFTYFWLGLACLFRITALIVSIVHSSVSDNNNCVIDRTDADFAITIFTDLGTFCVLAIVSTLGSYFMATYYTNQAAMASDTFDSESGNAKFQKPWMFKPAQIGFAAVNIVVLAVLMLRDGLCWHKHSVGNAMEIALAAVMIFHVLMLARGGKLLVKSTGVQKPGLRGTERMIFWVMLCLTIRAIFYALRFVDDYLYFDPDNPLAESAEWDVVVRAILAGVELAMLGVILNRIRPQGRAENERSKSMRKQNSFSSHGSFLVRKPSDNSLHRASSQGNAMHEVGRSIDLSGLVADRKSEASPSWLQTVLANERLRQSLSDRGSTSPNRIDPLDDPDLGMMSIKVRGSENSLPTHFESEEPSQSEVEDADELKSDDEFAEVMTPASGQSEASQED